MKVSASRCELLVHHELHQSHRLDRRRGSRLGLARSVGSTRPARDGAARKQ